MTTVFFTEEQFAVHTLHGHPEHAGRLAAIMERFEEFKILPLLKRISAAPATDEQLLAVHTQHYLNLLEKTTLLDRTAMLGADTYVTPDSYSLARLAAGGVIAVVDAVMRGEAKNGMALVRPPGHHATPDQAMGFCLLSNIAIAARHAYKTYGLERVAIIDYDVHHGNGTQDCLYEDGTILFISSHQSPLYPGTGAMEEIGRGAGKGFTVNIPLPPGTGDEGFHHIYDQVVIPLLKRFQPQLMLISAGYDAHWADPLANLTLSLPGFQYLVQQLMAAASSYGEGRIVFVMEGGYDLQALSYGWLNVANALLGRDEFHDPFGGYQREKTLPSSLMDRLITLHKLT